MDMMTATRNHTVVLLLETGREEWSDDDTSYWVQRIDLRTQFGDAVRFEVTHVASTNYSTYPIHQLQVTFDSAVPDRQWYVFSIDVSGADASVVGAVPDSAPDTYVARFRVDSHPVVTHVVYRAIGDQASRLTIRLSERVLLERDGAQVLVTRGDGAYVPCHLDLALDVADEPLNIIELVCDDLVGAEMFTVSFSPDVATETGSPLYGFEDRSPAVATWSRSHAIELAGSYVAVPDSPWGRSAR